MAEEKKYLPQSGAGLIRYFDVEEQIKVKPNTIVYVSIAFAAIVMILKFLA